MATVKALASTIRPLQVLAAYDLYPDLFVMVMQGLTILRVWPEEWAERLLIFAYYSDRFACFWRAPRKLSQFEVEFVAW